ncbi:MAG: hypothetical protein ACREEC_01310 [Thermoplasmata archaeon]
MTSRLVYVAATAAGAVLVVIVLVLALQGSGPSAAMWGPGQSRPFNLSGSFPTGNASYNGQLDCGSNVTENVTFPAPGILYYNITQNLSGASVNVWIVYPGGYSFQASGSPGHGGGSIGYNLGSFHFGFIACGSTPTVALGLWGTVVYSNHGGLYISGESNTTPFYARNQ